ncbi:(2Fe-2S)-binding protein [Acidimangrovimonas sediminis]|uniref:(2Fe-2S)-binding protein n=1 Tax=Acidimangrovimonas sediminis TaxID=2056283 RepID=UPI000C8059DD|nr:(2Fe-2S)-binding protein [Acidimangrovimonas sediminis]
MKTDLPFEPVARPEGVRHVTISFDGRDYDLPEGANLAAALLSLGERRFRATPVSGAPRGPFCMMGACFDCLVDIDGVTCQACMTEIREGMVILPARGRGQRP